MRTFFARIDSFLFKNQKEREMEGRNQKARTGPGPTNLEIHARICQLKIATSPHPSKMLQRGGNVFPLVSKTTDNENKIVAGNESK